MDNPNATPASGVLVTGANNGLGRETARLLAKAGYSVTGTVTGSAEAAALRAEGILPAYPNLSRAGEIRSAVTAAQAKIIVHLATQALNEPPQNNNRWDTDLLVANAAALVEAARAAEVEYLVYGSFAFIESATDHAGDDAKAIIRAARKAEAAVLNSGLPAVVLRFGYVYGAESAVLKRLQSALRLGRPVPVGSEHGHAPWIYARDAAEAVLAALEKRPAGAVLTIVDDRPASPAAFLRHFAEAQGMIAPDPLPRFIARTLTSKAQDALMDLDFQGSNAAAKETLGWSPRFPSYQHGIEDLLLTWRAQAAQAAAR